MSITDTALLKHLVESNSKIKRLITIDSNLSNYAVANNIAVIDLVQNRNETIRNS